jgi:TfoX/Sxy family transcriptional regulator of competence genes
MADQPLIVAPGPDARSVRIPDGTILHPPADWVLLLPGDAALTRRVKAAGPTWVVQEKRGRKIFSRGVWAPQAVVEAIRQQLAAERCTPAYARKREANAHRRGREQAGYVEDFCQAVLSFLTSTPVTQTSPRGWPGP